MVVKVKVFFISMQLVLDGKDKKKYIDTKFSA
jgi:hypothetical protein